MSGKSPVYLLMGKEDTYQIILIAIMDLFLKCLIDRNKHRPKFKYRFERIHKLLMETEQIYEGAIPEEVGNAADRFNNMINADLNYLLKTVKE